MSSGVKGPGRFSQVFGCRSMPPALNLTEFIMARAPDVMGLYEGYKPRFPVIPRNKRRRMRSYKPFFDRPKMPKTGTRKKKISRRTYRFKKLFVDEAVVTGRILPYTHLWHAKRFHMEDMWNMRLPIRTACSGERCIWKSAKKGVVIHDRSYMDCWIGDEAVPILSRMNSAGCFTGCNLIDLRIVNGEFIACGWIRRLDDKREISPFHVVCGSQYPIAVWTHPSARVECESRMIEAGLRLTPRAARYELIGARAMDKLCRFLGDNVVVDTIQGKIQGYDGVSVVVRDSGRLIDLFVDPETAHSAWVKLVEDETRSIGMLDRHSLLSKLYSVPDFPFDFPTTSAGAQHSAMASKKRVEEDLARPPNNEINPNCVESSFFPDWRLVSDDSRLQHVVIEPSTKGCIRPNAHVYVDERLVGYVTTPVSVDSGASIALISITVDMKCCNQVTFKNPGSYHVYNACVQRCRWSSTDSVLLGTLRN